MRVILSALLSLVCLSFTLWAGTTGKIAGRVTDQATGEPLPGVNVYIESIWFDDIEVDMSEKQGSTSDMDGYYQIINISPGTYTLRATSMGYSALKQTNVFVRVDQTTPLNFKLSETTLQIADVIVIEAEQPKVEKDVTSTKRNVSADKIDNMPVNSLNEIINLQAGVVNSGGVHVRGGRTGEVAYLIDGHRLEDPLFGSNTLEINNEAIQQMEMISGTFNAEYGNAMSGVVNIVTKENVSSYGGRLLYRRTNLGLEDASDNYNQQIIEGFVNGPLYPKSSIGFLISGKISTRDNYYESGVLDRGDPTDPYGTPSGKFSGNAFGYNDLNSFFGKLFFKPFSAGKISLSYKMDDQEWMNYVHANKYIPDSSYVRQSASQFAGLSFTHTLSVNLFYEFRLSYYKYHYKRNYNDLIDTLYTPSGKIWLTEAPFNLQAANSEYDDETVQTFTEKFDLTWQMDRFNLLKAGFEFNQHDLEYYWSYDWWRGANRYLNDYEEKPYEAAAYIQDKIEFESIILNAGLRFDYYHPNINYIDNVASGATKDASAKTQISPRLGIAYPISDKTVFHFAYGHFFQRPDYRILYEDLSRNLNVNKPLFGDPDMDPEKTVSYELGLHTYLNENVTLQTTVFSKKISGLIGVGWHFREADEPYQYAYFTNEDFAYVKGFEISGDFNWKFISLGANYTFSIAEGSSSSQEEKFEGAYDVKGRQSMQFYPLEFDQRHSINANLGMSFNQGEGPFNLAPSVFQNSFYTFIFRYGSGLPYTYNPTRKRYEPNLNNARRPSTWSVDLEAEKRFKIGRWRIGVNFQIYNLTNRKNVLFVYTATGKPDDPGPNADPLIPEYINDPTKWSSPRTIYLGMNVSF